MSKKTSKKSDLLKLFKKNTNGKTETRVIPQVSDYQITGFQRSRVEKIAQFGIGG